MTEPTEIWSIAFCYWSDSGSYRSEWYETIDPDRGFYLTEAEAQAETERLNQTVRDLYDAHIAALEKKDAEAVESYNRLLREDKETVKKNKVLKAAGFTTMPPPERRKPSVTRKPDFEEWSREYSVYKPIKIERSA